MRIVRNYKNPELFVIISFYIELQQIVGIFSASIYIFIKTFSNINPIRKACLPVALNPSHGSFIWQTNDSKWRQTEEFAFGELHVLL